MLPNAEFDKTRLLVLQGTPFCNLDCSYCYLSKESRSDRSTMPVVVARKAARFLRVSDQVGDSLTVLWHAGEPLTIRPQYYEDTIDAIESELGDTTNLKYSLQTNAVGINDAWCELIKCKGIGVGVSLDGPQAINDAYRVTKGGKGSFSHVMKGIQKLKDHDISFSIICVITANSLDYPEEIAAFLSSLGPVSIGFNVEEIEAHNLSSSLLGAQDASIVLDRKIRGFIEGLYDYMQAQGDIALCREFKRNLMSIDNPDADPRRGENKAFRIVTVAQDGRLSTFAPELCGFEVDGYGDFTFGTVDSSMSEIVASPRFQQAYASIESGVSRCQESCSHYGLCGGGSPSNKYNENGSFDTAATKYCTYHQKYFIDTVVQGLQNELQSASGTTL